MAWLYVPGLEASSLASSSRSATPTTPSATWRGKPLSPRIWSREWNKGSFVTRLSGTTSTPSTLDRGVARFIASLPAFPASPSQSPAPGKAKTMNAGCGLPSRESLATYSGTIQRNATGLPSSSWRTSRPSLFMDSETFSERWPTSGLLQRGICFQHPTWVVRTDVSGSFLSPLTSDTSTNWRTPDAPDGGSHRTHSDATMGNGHQVALADQASRWPTPRTISGGAESAEEKQAHGRLESGGGDLQAAVKNWPTACVTDATSSARHTAETGIMNPGTSLTDTIRAWPTPTTHDTRSGKGEQKRVGTPALNEVVDRWPTPTLEPDAPNTNSNQVNGFTSLGEASRSFHLDRAPSKPGRQSSLFDQTSPPASADEAWKTPHGFANLDASGKVAGGGGEFHKQAMQWRTPATTDVAVPTEKLTDKDGNPPALGQRMYRANEDGSQVTSRSGERICQSQTLGLQVALTAKDDKAQLNPMFVEYLMGWPIGWTGSELAATEWFHFKRRMRYALSRLVSGGT